MIKSAWKKLNNWFKEFMEAFKVSYKSSYSRTTKACDEWAEVKKLVDKDGKARASYLAFIAGMKKASIQHPLSAWAAYQVLQLGNRVPFTVEFERNYHVSILSTPKEAYLFIEYAGIFLDTVECFGHGTGMLYKLDPQATRQKKSGVFDYPEVIEHFEEFVRERPDSDEKNKDIIANYKFAM